jgi:hypothetical protein
VANSVSQKTKVKRKPHSGARTPVSQAEQQNKPSRKRCARTRAPVVTVSKAKAVTSVLPTSNARLLDLWPRQLGVQFDSQLPYDTWRDIGVRIGRAGTRFQFVVGDWLLFGEQKYGAKYLEAQDLTGLSYGTLANLKYIAGAIDFHRRRENLSYGHHVEIAALDPADGDRLLDQAEAEGWNREQLRQAVRELKAKLAGPPANQIASDSKIKTSADKVEDRRSQHTFTDLTQGQPKADQGAGKGAHESEPGPTSSSEQTDTETTEADDVEAAAEVKRKQFINGEPTKPADEPHREGKPSTRAATAIAVEHLSILIGTEADPVEVAQLISEKLEREQVDVLFNWLDQVKGALKVGEVA